MKKVQVGTLFPNLEPSAGYYSPTNFCITLEGITKRQLQDMIMKKQGFIEKRKVLHHEIRHHLDHVSTLWGHGQILSLQEAVDARLDKDEDKYRKIADYKRSENQFHYFKYYTMNKGFAIYRTPADQWSYKITSGARFGADGKVAKDKFILLVWFHPPASDAFMGVPLTIASLLEINSIYEETMIEREVIENIDAKDREKARQSYIKKLVSGVIYNQAAIEYNCGVHLVANSFRIGDPYEAFESASAIATIVLNLPYSLLGKIPIDKVYMKQWGDRPEDFIHDHNHGFIYFNMVHNYREYYKATGKFDIAEFLKVNQLPEQAAIEEMVSQQMQANMQSVNDGSYLFKTFLEHLVSGATLFNRRGLDGKRESLRDTLYSGDYAPLIVEKDSAFLGKYRFDEVFKNKEKLTYADPNEWYHLSVEVNEKMDEFYQICGI
jgi:hypothetical protein